jgi:hypothetical protein
MDGVGSGRWSDTIIKAVANSVFDAEWSEILNAAPTYRFAQRSVTTDANGQVAFSALNGGSGDSAQNWYRIISVTNGNVSYRETRFQDVPLGTSGQAQNSYDKLYYLVGETLKHLQHFDRSKGGKIPAQVPES